MRFRAILALCSLGLVAGCFDSHEVGGFVGPCTGGPPMCFSYDPSERCCTDSGPSAECTDEGWTCPSGTRSDADCPAFCMTGGCDMPPPPGIFCREVAPDGCCTSDAALVCDRRTGIWSCAPGSIEIDRCPDCAPICPGDPPECATVIEAPFGTCCEGGSVMAECRGRAWQCPEGTVERFVCDEIGFCGSGGRCDGLSHVTCLREGCAPVYDDACCPTCSDTPFCADCTDMVFDHCEAFDARCFDGGPPLCGTIADGLCAGDLPDCAGAFPTSDRGCSIAGCIPAVPGGCPDCMPSCVPMRENSCEVFCFREPPDCPPGMVPEAARGCFTDLCIPASACAP